MLQLATCARAPWLGWCSSARIWGPAPVPDTRRGWGGAALRGASGGRLQFPIPWSRVCRSWGGAALRASGGRLQFAIPWSHQSSLPVPQASVPRPHRPRPRASSPAAARGAPHRRPASRRRAQRRAVRPSLLLRRPPGVLARARRRLQLWPRLQLRLPRVARLTPSALCRTRCARWKPRCCVLHGPGPATRRSARRLTTSPQQRASCAAVPASRRLVHAQQPPGPSAGVGGLTSLPPDAPVPVSRPCRQRRRPTAAPPSWLLPCHRRWRRPRHPPRQTHPGTSTRSAWRARRPSARPGPRAACCRQTWTASSAAPPGRPWAARRRLVGARTAPTPHAKASAPLPIPAPARWWR